MGVIIYDIIWIVVMVALLIWMFSVRKKELGTIDSIQKSIEEFPGVEDFPDLLKEAKGNLKETNALLFLNGATLLIWVVILISDICK